jgi:hypothetical protein
MTWKHCGVSRATSKVGKPAARLRRDKGGKRIFLIEIKTAERPAEYI